MRIPDDTAPVGTANASAIGQQGHHPRPNPRTGAWPASLRLPGMSGR